MYACENKLQTYIYTNTYIYILWPTFAGSLDADWLEASIEGGGINDVRVKVAVVLPVDEERHDHRDNQAHDHRDHDAHIQRYIICTGSHWKKRKGWGRGGGQNTKENCILRSNKFNINSFLSPSLQEL